MARHWRIAAHDAGYVGQLAADLKIPALVAQVLAARGCRSAADAQAFLARKLTDLHDPELLPGVSQAADRLVEAVKAGRRITVYGDYDVDGVTATSLLWHCLQLAGGRVDYYIPCRMEEGYGLNCDALRQLHTEDPSRIVISVDCGITSVAEAVLAKEIGLELIITDHHQFSESLPDTLLVHPRLPGGSYPFGDLCGVGVAFKLAWAICARLGDGKKASPRMREFLLSAIGLTAIGTVADVVPLIGENRVLVSTGLGGLLERANPGLRALLTITGLAERESLQAEDLGFAIGPRINAAGRLGQARLAVELLTTDSAERATALAAYLDELNKNRQTVERRMLKQAKEMVEEHPQWQDEPALVLAHADWHAGVIGIVANRVADAFQKPAILLSYNGPQGLAQGSGRSHAGFNLHAGLTACQELLTTFGGHHAAVGLKISPDRIDAFREQFTQYVAAHHRPTAEDVELAVDAEVRLQDITPRAVEQLERLGPFGAANARPVFAASGVQLAAPPKKMGEGERHLSLLVRQYGETLRAVAFGRGEWADEMAAHSGDFAICFQPVINRFRGQAKAELQLVDWRAESTSSAASPRPRSSAVR